MTLSKTLRRFKRRHFSGMCLTLIGMLCLVFYSFETYAAPLHSDNNKIKTGLIYNFLKLTQWPDRTETQDHLQICLLGGDPFNSSLNFLAGRIAQKRIIEIEERNNPYFVNGCHLAFINSSKEAEFEDILKALKGKPILSVSDIEGFSRRGGMIEVAQRDNHQIYLNINIKAIENTSLRIHDDLLKMAEMIWLK